MFKQRPVAGHLLSKQSSKLYVLLSAAALIILLGLFKPSYAISAANPLADYQALINQASKQPVTNGSQGSSQFNSATVNAAQAALQAGGRPTFGLNSPQAFNAAIVPNNATNTSNQVNANSAPSAPVGPPNIFVTPNTNSASKPNNSVIHY